MSQVRGWIPNLRRWLGHCFIGPAIGFVCNVKDLPGKPDIVLKYTYVKIDETPAHGKAG